MGRVDDIENDVLLPFMSRETVLLDLDPYALMSYNAMQAVIAVNAVDSERTDQVSMQQSLHRRAIDHFRRTICFILL